AERLVEGGAVLATVDQNRVKRPVEIVTRTDTRREHRLDRILDGGRPHPHAGLAQRAGEIDDIVGDAPFGIRFCCSVGGHGYSAAESSALTSSRMRRPSPCPMRAMSSWYFSSTPMVSEMVSGSSAILSNSVSAPAQSMVSATPGTLNRSISRSFCTNETTSADRRLLACGTLVRTISSSRAASG